ncbi:inhibitor of cysteine peptidase [Caulobacter sp. UNC279MFTsu5.1]|nr:inhibitor of cysteine peptidase [Caulobacter sp. UNC279MFTsu5.1]
MKTIMKTKQIPILALVGLLALPAGLSACASAAPPAARVVTEADGGPVGLARGQTLEVRLGSNAGTGYAWRLDREASPLVLSGGSSQDVAASPGLPGGRLTTVYTYQGAGRGRAELAFTFKRPWEPDKPDDRKVVFKVRVR